jgi:hypothetical protein
VLAIASVVIGITVPTALQEGKLDIARVAGGCCGVGERESPEACVASENDRRE